MKRRPYEVKIKSLSSEGKNIYVFDSADGVLSKDEIRGEVLKLLENVRGSNINYLLNIDCNYGALGIILADEIKEGVVYLQENSARAIKLTKHNIKKYNVDNAKSKLNYNIEDLELSNPIDTIVYCPKPFEPNDIIHQKILEGFRKLEMGGSFYLSAHKNKGGKTYGKYLNKYSSSVKTLDKSEGYRVYRAVKDRKISLEKKYSEYDFESEVKGIKCKFKTRPGIFSYKKIDMGTKLLIKEMEIKKEDKVLDLGCGYGPLGIYASKINDSEVYFTDDNSVSTRYAEINCELNDVDKRKIVTDDCLESFRDIKFNKILTNPPTHSGSDVIQEIFTESYKRLVKGGYLYLVYNEILNYESQLKGLFGEAEILKNKNKFKIVRAKKSK